MSLPEWAKVPEYVKCFEIKIQSASQMQENLSDWLSTEKDQIEIIAAWVNFDDWKVEIYYWAVKDFLNSPLKKLKDIFQTTVQYPGILNETPANDIIISQPMDKIEVDNKVLLSNQSIVFQDENGKQQEIAIKLFGDIRTPDSTDLQIIKEGNLVLKVVIPNQYPYGTGMPYYFKWLEIWDDNKLFTINHHNSVLLYRAVSITLPLYVVDRYQFGDSEKESYVYGILVSDGTGSNISSVGVVEKLENISWQ